MVKWDGESERKIERSKKVYGFLRCSGIISPIYQSSSIEVHTLNTSLNIVIWSQCTCWKSLCFGFFPVPFSSLKEKNISQWMKITRCMNSRFLLHSGTVLNSNYNFNCISNHRTQVNVKSHITLASPDFALVHSVIGHVIGHFFPPLAAQKFSWAKNWIPASSTTCIQSNRNTNTFCSVCHIQFTGFLNKSTNQTLRNDVCINTTAGLCQ